MPDILDALEAVDAAIFTGDALYTDLDALKVYVFRWNRSVLQHEAIMALPDPEEES